MNDEDEKLQLDTARNVLTLRNNMPALIELAKLQAELTRAKYWALVQNGFSPAEALELCAKL